MESITRRNFIKATGLAGAAATVAAPLTAHADEAPAAQVQYSFEIPPEPVPEDEIVETYETEVVVIGGGTAGLVTANAAMDFGARVILFSGSSKAGSAALISAIMRFNF